MRDDSLFVVLVLNDLTQSQLYSGLLRPCCFILRFHLSLYLKIYILQNILALFSKYFKHFISEAPLSPRISNLHPIPTQGGSDGWKFCPSAWVTVNHTQCLLSLIILVLFQQLKTSKCLSARCIRGHHCRMSVSVYRKLTNVFFFSPSSSLFYMLSKVLLYITACRNAAYHGITSVDLVTSDGSKHVMEEGTGLG